MNTTNEATVDRERRRADAWKKLALATRNVNGELMGLLGECAGFLSLGDVKDAALAERCEHYVEGVNVPIPGNIARELLDAERAMEFSKNPR